jgi:ABC-2 type transport system ATP-binding protein
MVRRVTAAVVEVRGLTKAYRGRFRGTRRRALDGLDLSVQAGGRVHGFLGPNGSGKTTTLRTLVGLVRPDSGDVLLFGRAVPRELPAVVPQVGSLIEAPQFFRNFSGRRNLRYLNDVAGLPATRVDEVLEVVDLSDRADDLVKGYSLGMRQRLAIAAALLKQPSLLLLDEPSNGLDPAGIRDVRSLLRRLAGEGTTVLLSSHLLAEVEQVCDEVTIVAHGRTVASGLVRDVLSQATAGGGRVRARVPDPSAAQQVLTTAGLNASTDDGQLVVTGVDDPAVVTRALADAGIYLSELTPDRVGLEEAFLLLTDEHGDEHGDEDRDEAAS